MKYLLLIIFIVVAQVSPGQDDPYRGGSGDGHHFTFFVTEGPNFTSGSMGDGFASNFFKDSLIVLSLGGGGDGYHYTEVLNGNLYFTYGGNGDGYHRIQWLSPNYDFSRGNFGDGYTGHTSQSTIPLFTIGGKGDGYSYTNFEVLYWTGNVNENWNNTGNWSHSTVPNAMDNVYIPNNRPYYPFLTNDSLSINPTISGSGYECKSIFIDSSASITGSTSAYIINQGEIILKGIIDWKNSVSGSVLNEPGGSIVVRENGMFLIGF